jgi:hypothetical protein
MMVLFLIFNFNLNKKFHSLEFCKQIFVLSFILGLFIIKKCFKLQHIFQGSLKDKNIVKN